MILNFDQLNNQLYLLERVSGVYNLGGKVNIEPMKNYPTISLSGLFASIPIPRLSKIFRWRRRVHTLRTLQTTKSNVKADKLLKSLSAFS
jgi:hypothetical protein